MELADPPTTPGVAPAPRAAADGATGPETSGSGLTSVLARARGTSGFAVDSMALVLSGGLTGLLGLVFWAAAARHYSVAEIGRGSAVVTSAIMLATLSNLSLGGMYERFLPVAGHRAARLLIAGPAVTTVLAFGLGTGFVLLAPAGHVLTTPTERLTFPLFVAVLALFALQDNVLTGLRGARWAAVKNLFHSVAKLALVVVLGVTASGFAIAVSWTAPAALAAAVVVGLVVRAVRRDPVYAVEPALPPRRELFSFFVTTYGLTVVASLAPLVIPLIVVNQLGVESNGYFTMAWTLVTAVAMVMSVAAGPFIAEAAAQPDRLWASTRRFLVLLSGVALLGALFLLVGAPLLLSVFGRDYGAQGRDLVQVMALAMLLSAVPAFYGALARVRRRLGLAALVQVAGAVVLIGGTFLLAPRLGLVGIGWAYVAAEVFACLVVLGPVSRQVRRPAGSPEEWPGSPAPATAPSAARPGRRPGTR